jgi:hypothetical protein
VFCLCGIAIVIAIAIVGGPCDIVIGNVDSKGSSKKEVWCGIHIERFFFIVVGGLQNTKGML